MAKKKCNKGWGCGGSCISRKKSCKSNLDQEGKKIVENFTSFLKRVSEGGGGTNPAIEDVQPGEIESGVKKTPKKKRTVKKVAKPEPVPEPKLETKPEPAPEPKPEPAPDKFNTPTREEAKKDLKFLGGGIAGEVYEDGKNNHALKYSRGRTLKGMQEIDGLTEDLATKRFEESNEGDEIEQVGYNLIADLELGPRFHGVEVQEDEDGLTQNKVYRLDLLKGYNEGFSEDGDVGKQTDNFISGVKKVAQAGYALDDMKEDNFMSDPKTNEVRFIDQGGVQFNNKPEDISDLMFNTQSWRPMTAEIISSDIVSKMKGKGEDKKAQRKEWKALQKLWKKHHILGEEINFEELNNRMFKLMEQVGY